MFENNFRLIKNSEELLLKGNIKGRRVALQVLEYALKKVDTYNAVKRIIGVEEDRLFVGEIEYELLKLHNIYVLGAGKSSFEIAKALENTLQERIKDGVIIEKRGMGKKLSKIRVFEAGHPIPDESGLEGAVEIAKLANQVDEGDLVFLAITGGCSALMPLPAEGLTLEDKKTVNRLLLKCGAAIEEINTVRKHLSKIKGGRLALMIHPAEMVNLIVMDEVAGKPWGPTISDETTFEDAVAVLIKYNLWEIIPENVRIHLENADKKSDTPKEEEFEALGVKASTFILTSNADACEAAAEEAERFGYNASILTTSLEGESKDVGIALSTVAREVESECRPIKSPCVIVSGGETTVTMIGEVGEGGRNQELALSASLKIAGSKHIVLASLGTDGTDGPTEIAGAIVDGYTVSRAQQIGLDLVSELKNHNSSYVFKKLGDALYTGPTGTNVMDLQVIVVTK
jgi:glycerate-2-kinase